MTTFLLLSLTSDLVIVLHIGHIHRPLIVDILTMSDNLCHAANHASATPIAIGYTA